MQLDSELELVSDPDAASFRILQTFGQALGQSEVSCELVALGRFIDNLQAVLSIQFVLIRGNRPRVLVRIPERFGVVGIQGKIVSFDELRHNLPDVEAFEEGY